MANSHQNADIKPENAEHLKDRGILYAPDYVINAGGVIFIVGMEIQGWTKEQVENEVTEGIQNVLQQIFELSTTKGITTEAAARQIAEERLSSDT